MICWPPVEIQGWQSTQCHRKHAGPGEGDSKYLKCSLFSLPELRQNRKWKETCRAEKENRSFQRLQRGVRKHWRVPILQTVTLKSPLTTLKKNFRIFGEKNISIFHAFYSNSWLNQSARLKVPLGSTFRFCGYFQLNTDLPNFQLQDTLIF